MTLLTKPPRAKPALLIAAVALAALMTSSGRADGLLAITGARIETATDDGLIEDGVILIRDGKIEEVGADVDIPGSAAVIRADGKTVMPGIIDPYYVVTVPSSSAGSTQRTIVFRGRTFVIGGSPAATDTSFVKVADAFQPARWEWRPAVRSGITTAHLVTRGYGQSCLASPRVDPASISLDSGEPRTFIAVSNEPKSLKVLRTGLKKKSSSSSGSSASKTSSGSSSSTARSSSGAASSTSSSSSSSASTAADVWEEVRSGKFPLVVNANNASAVLYLVEELKKEENKDVKVALVLSGSDAILTLDQLPAERVTLVLAPRLETEPTTRRLINVANEAVDRGMSVAFSLSTNQSNFRSSQDIPLFAVGQLTHLGLDRDTAIRSLTRTPAEVLGLEDEYGTIEKGRYADLLIFDSDPLSATGRIERVLSRGETVYQATLQP
ncbi:MAG: amidohydrolase family protein [Planctomycetota bacterium]